MWGDKELDVQVFDITIEAEHEYMGHIYGSEVFVPHTQTFTLTGRLNKIGVSEMMNEGRNLVRRLKDLELDEDTQVLRKHGIVDDAGAITDSGVYVVAQRLLEQNKAKIVANLKKLDKEEK